MSTWYQVECAAPELAAAVRSRIQSHRHLTMATLRRDGAPRISGTEVVLRDGELWLAGMAGARRLSDLRRDARVAVHSGSDDPPGWSGDAKIAGYAAEVTGSAQLAMFAGGQGPSPPGLFELFRIEICEVVHIGLGGPPDHLVVWAWHEGRGLTRVERR